MNTFYLKLICLIKGTCRLRLSNKYFNISSMAIIVIPAPDTCSYDFTVGSDYREIIYAQESLPYTLTQLLPLKDPFDNIFNLKNGKATIYYWTDLNNNMCFSDLVTHMEEYDRTDNNGTSASLRYKQSILICISHLILKSFGKHYSIDISHVCSRNEKYLINYLSTNYRTATLKNTAEHFSYSEEYLSRYILKLTGRHFVEILSEIRLLKAKQMLQNYHITEDEIAVSVGYSSLRYFRLVYKEYFGVTPRMYRKRMGFV